MIVPAETPALELRAVTYAYESGPILEGVSCAVSRADFVVLLGANGSGKSTLVKVAVGLLEPQTGEAFLFGHPVRDARARAGLGYVPQRAAISPRVPATVEEVVLAGRAGRGALGFWRRADREAAAAALARVGLADLATRRIGDLSGGQQQRVLIARALVSDPSLLVLDEPTAGVDQASQLRFADGLRDLHREGVAIFIVAHDLGAVASHVTRVIVLHQGHLDEMPVDTVRAQVGMFVEDHP